MLMTLGFTMQVRPVREKSMQEAECRCLSACNISRFSSSGRDVFAAIGYSGLGVNKIRLYLVLSHKRPDGNASRDLYLDLRLTC